MLTDSIFLIRLYNLSQTVFALPNKSAKMDYHPPEVGEFILPHFILKLIFFSIGLFSVFNYLFCNIFTLNGGYPPSNRNTNMSSIKSFNAR